MKLCAVLCVLVVCAFAVCSSKRYDGYKLYRVTFEKGRASQVQAMVDQMDGVEIWMLSIAKGTADIFVAPNVETHLLSGLRRNGLKFTLLNDNVQGNIDATALA